MRTSSNSLNTCLLGLPQRLLRAEGTAVKEMGEAPALSEEGLTMSK